MTQSAALLPRLAIVIPCYNEDAVLPHSLMQLTALLCSLKEQQRIAADSFLYCVDDGSQDNTWQLICCAHQTDPHIKGLRLTKNMGHQNALLAGLLQVKGKCDCAITIDADLQDDINAIPAMLAQFNAGNDIVYGIRDARINDSLFKRLTAMLFYRIMKQSGADILINHADFRLLSRRAITALNRYQERNLFLRGIFPLMGYPSANVTYQRQQRLAGTPKYTLKKMLSLAWNGITSFSHVPLRLILCMGVMSFVLSLSMMIWVFAAKFTTTTVPGWASIMVPLCFMGGIQLLSIGVIGEYIAKVYIEVKRRPRFLKDMELF